MLPLSIPAIKSPSSSVISQYSVKKCTCQGNPGGWPKSLDGLGPVAQNTIVPSISPLMVPTQMGSVGSEKTAGLKDTSIVLPYCLAWAVGMKTIMIVNAASTTLNFFAKFTLLSFFTLTFNLF
ncbi:MAG: hypothetical protein ACTSQU_05585 [Promethearchaeota archaeon]